ncbi:MAG: zinc-binding alcohol dehydrogenase family protein [Castellaniella sp.]|uniref:quinone oxidoreductase family protein n=1 Tax=Castellaniella sp. TaxID=1955812 RepID=UPI003C70CE96
MKLVQMNAFGGPEVLETLEVTPPGIQADDEILVRVRASGINFFELLMRRDQYAVTPPLPARFGVEIAGTVEAAGPQAGIAMGSRVAVPLFAIGRDGGYAEYVVAKAAAAVPVPEGVPFDAAVALQVQGLTALHAVRRTAPAGRSVLVTAAGGGVGTLLIQLLKQAGAGRVVALAGSEAKRQMALSLGADQAVNHRDEGWLAHCRAAGPAAGFDLIYDFVGGDWTRQFTRLLAPAGVLLFGALGRFTLATSEVSDLIDEAQTIQGFALLPLLKTSDVGRDLAALFQRVVSKDLKPVIGGRFPLAHAARAHQLLESRSSMGKVVLEP